LVFLGLFAGQCEVQLLRKPRRNTRIQVGTRTSKKQIETIDGRGFIIAHKFIAGIAAKLVAIFKEPGYANVLVPFFRGIDCALRNPVLEKRLAIRVRRDCNATSDLRDYHTFFVCESCHVSFCGRAFRVVQLNIEVESWSPAAVMEIEQYTCPLRRVFTA